MPPWVGRRLNLYIKAPQWEYGGLFGGVPLRYIRFDPPLKSWHISPSFTNIIFFVRFIQTISNSSFPGITMLMKRSTAEYIHSVPDLLANQHVLFGTLDSGSTYNFFRVSNYYSWSWYTWPYNFNFINVIICWLLVHQILLFVPYFFFFFSLFFVQTSMIGDYERVYWHFMPGSEDRRGVLTTNTEAGVNLVRSGYLYFSTNHHDSL